MDGGGGCEALRPAGERRGVSTCTGFGALRPVVHGGGCRSASGAHLGLDLHAGGPCVACQQVSLTCGLWGKKGPTDSGAHLWDVNTGLERHDQYYSTLWISSMQSETLIYCVSFLILVLLYFYKNH